MIKTNSEKVYIDKKLFTIYLPVFLLVFVSNDTYLFGTNSNSFMVSVPRYFLLLFCVVEAIPTLYSINLELDNKSIGIYLWMFFILCIVSLIHPEIPKRVILKLLCLTTGFFFATRRPMEDFVGAYIDVLSFLAVFSIALNIVAMLFPSLAMHLPTIINTAGTQISTCYLAGVQTNQIGDAIIRSFGIFWEPGVYQIYLNIAVVFLLFFQNEIKRKQLLVLVIALLLTFSTTGYIVLALVFAVYFLPQNRGINKRYIGVIAIIVLASLLVIQLLGYALVLDRVFGKLTGTSHYQDTSRMGSIIVNVYVFIHHPFVGIGMNNMETEFVRLSKVLQEIPTNHNTNTILYQFAAHGLLWGIPFLLGTISCMLKARTNKIARICLVIAILLLYSGENLWHSVLPYLLIFYGFKNAKSERKVSIVYK